MRQRPSIGRNAAVDETSRTVSIVMPVFLPPDFSAVIACDARLNVWTSGWTPRSIFRQDRHYPHGTPGSGELRHEIDLANAVAKVVLPMPLGPEIRMAWLT